MVCLYDTNVNVSSGHLHHPAVGSHRKPLTLIWEITASRLPEIQGVHIGSRGVLQRYIYII